MGGSVAPDVPQSSSLTPDADDLIEHVLRVTSDPDVLVWLAGTTPLPAKASLRHIASLTETLDLPLAEAAPVGSPLAVWIWGGALDDNWRERVPTGSGSLWAQVEGSLPRQASDLLAHVLAVFS